MWKARMDAWRAHLWVPGSSLGPARIQGHLLKLPPTLLPFSSHPHHRDHMLSKFWRRVNPDFSKPALFTFQGIRVSDTSGIVFVSGICFVYKYPDISSTILNLVMMMMMTTMTMTLKETVWLPQQQIAVFAVWGGGGATTVIA